MNTIRQTADVYDRMFREGGNEGVYELPYRHSGYYPLFREVLREAKRRGASAILEVGCGTGGFAHMVLERSSIAYTGFDFSEVAVGKAIVRTGRADAFFVGDATDPRSYQWPSFDCIVCTEVLEHVEPDLEVIGNWKSGTACVCSVPNFDADTHVRYFGSIDEVRDRYAGLIDIERVVRIKKPFLSDISVASVLRALRWNRYRPRRLLAIAGVLPFESTGGWFLFSGQRR